MAEVSLVCSKCDAPIDAKAMACAKCGGSVAKRCPQCEFKNSLAKKYCDRCGHEFALAGGAQNGTGDIPKTAIQRSSEAPGQLNLPQAGRLEQYYSSGTPTPASRQLPTATPRGRGVPLSFSLFPGGFAYFVRSVLAILFLLAVTFALLLFGLMQLEARSPKVAVKRLAERYLLLLSRNDYGNAYYMLSPEAQAACPIDEFRELRDTAAWTWSDLELAKVEPQSIFLRYDLRVSGNFARADFLHFVKEGDRWVRPYNWCLLREAQNALATGDPDLAVLKAGEAVRIDPREPVSRGILCEAAYARKVPDQVERECTLALETARDYPSSLPAAGVYRIYALLAEALVAEGKWRNAAEAYTAMASFPAISSEDVCKLTLARGQAELQLGETAGAVSDFKRAARACPDPADRAAARQRLGRISPGG